MSIPTPVVSMATAATIRRPLTEAASARRADVITGLLGLWMTFGGYIDAWAHTHLISTQESFFTPWHAILYSGWLGTAAWIYLHRDRPGYRLGLIGAIGFGIGGVIDMAWHIAFGIESNAEALISPPHLFLLASHLLIISTPLRAAWASNMPRRVNWRGFAPIGLSLIAGVALFGFIVMYGSPFNDYLPSTTFTEGVFGPDTRYRIAQKAGLLTFYVTALIYVTPLLAILKRWRPPFGTATLVMGLPALGIMAVDPLLLGAPILAASGIAAGIFADVLIAELDPSPDRRNAFLIFGALTPVPIVALSLLAVSVEWGLGWGVNLVTGSMIISALVGFGLAVALSAPEAREVQA